MEENSRTNYSIAKSYLKYNDVIFVAEIEDKVPFFCLVVDNANCLTTYRVNMAKSKNKKQNYIYIQELNIMDLYVKLCSTRIGKSDLKNIYCRNN